MHGYSCSNVKLPCTGIDLPISEPVAAILPVGQSLNLNQPLDHGKVHPVNYLARPKPQTACETPPRQSEPM